MTADLSLDPVHYRELVRRELAADLGQAGDRTTDSIVPADIVASATVVARSPGRLCGLEVALEAFRLLDPETACERLHADGDDVEAGAALARVSGRARSLLTAERTALNFLGHLAGIATSTRELVGRIEGTKARVADTRKTTPGLRALEKHAVRAGGGVNHRFGLYDAVLIKDNHREIAGGVGAAIRAARSTLGHMVKLEVEVDTLDQLAEALAEGVDAVLLDNFSPADLRRAVAAIDGRALAEASGGIGPETIRAVAETGVDLISVGWITHSAPALDVALDFESR